MRKTAAMSLSTVLCLFLSVSATESSSIDGLVWLAGCWASVGSEPGSGEQWTAPAGKTMLGVSRTVRNSETVAYEFMQIREVEGGNIEFVAKPSGQGEATFVLTHVSESEVVFENPGHDFPQRIVYLLKHRGHLEARIEGRTNGELRVVTFPMRRIDCTPRGEKP